jgi:hypothetical protein
MISADSYHQCKIIYILITALLPDAVFTSPLGQIPLGTKTAASFNFSPTSATDDHKARSPGSTPR